MYEGLFKMGLQQTWSLLFAASCFLCFAYSRHVNMIHKSPLRVDDTKKSCCRFESNACDFSYNSGSQLSWYWSGDGTYPDTRLLPNFHSSSNYLWTQDDDQAITLSPLVENIQEYTQFGFNYYAHIEDPTSKISVYFSNSLGYPDLLIDSLFDTGESWRHSSFTCGATTCCIEYPCSGYIKVVVGVLRPTALYAIDDVEVNHGCTQLPTTTTSTPSPTPQGPKCCVFSFNTCGFTHTNPQMEGSWEWSGDGNSPDYYSFPLFPGDGYTYIFTQSDNGSTTYSEVFDAELTTEIGFTYYAHIEDPTGSSALYVYFENSDGSPDVHLDVLDETDEKWRYRSLTCGSHDCCATYPCRGNIKVVAVTGGFTALYAIEEVEIDDGCESTRKTEAASTTVAWITQGVSTASTYYW